MRRIVYLALGFAAACGLSLYSDRWAIRLIGTGLILLLGIPSFILVSIPLYVFSPEALSLSPQPVISAAHITAERIAEMIFFILSRP